MNLLPVMPPCLVAGLVLAWSTTACTTAQQGASGATSSAVGNEVVAPVVGPATAQGVHQPPAASTPEVRSANPAMLGVSDLAGQPAGANVTVSGVFMGWNGGCLGEAPSRSAWHLAASAEPGAPCVYVDGPYPPGFSPMASKGQATSVTGTVTDAGGMRYLTTTAP